MVGVGEAVPNSDEQFTDTKVSVWWDLQNCDILKDFDPHRVAHNICSALVRMNYHGPVSIFCYGDTTEIPESVHDALTTTGVLIKHVPADEKDGSYKRILVDMMLWAMDNPAPANCLLISDDVNFSYAIHQLLMKRYNILLAHSQNVSAPLLAVAKSVWLSTSLLAGGPPLSNGESLTLTSSVSIATQTQQHSEVNVGNLNWRNPIPSEPVSIGTQTQQQGSQPKESKAITHSKYVQRLIRVVLLALNSLKNEKIIPTQENITESIRYGDRKDRNTNVNFALAYAIREQMVVIQYLGSWTLYLGKNDKLWECLSPIGGSPNDYSEKVWDAIQLFLTSPAGRSKIMLTECRYQAAIAIKNMIKKTCYQDIVLGHVLQILNMLIVDKQWIDLSALSDWQPITITVTPRIRDQNHRRQQEKTHESN